MEREHIILVILLVILLVINILQVNKISSLKEQLDMYVCNEGIRLKTIKILRKKINNMTRAKGYREIDTWSYEKGVGKLIEIKKGKLQTNSNMETQELKKENIEKALKDLENIDFTKPIL